MKSKKEVIWSIAGFCIYLIVLLPFYVSEAYAVEPSLSNIQIVPSYDSALITWQTDVASDSIINYGKNSLVELSKSNSDLTTAHSVSLGPLTPNTQYYYGVKSCDGASCKSSSIVSFTTLTAPAPGKINGLSNGTITTRSAELRWIESSSAYFGYYIIYRNGNAITNISSKSTTSYLDEGVAGSTTYQYQVSVVNSNGIEGEKSDSLYLTTLTPDRTPPNIENLTISSISVDSATIVWNTNEESNSTVFYGLSTNSLNMIQSYSNYEKTHSIVLSNLRNQTTYFYKVVSCDIDRNCAEKFGNAFVPGEVRELSIQLLVPLIYNKAIVPVNGTVTPYTKVKFLVNDVYKGLVGIERNTNGVIRFDVPGFSSGNNTLKAVVEDSIGNTKEQTYGVFIDSAPPIVEITALPERVSSKSVVVNGSSNEPVDVKIYTRVIESEDTNAPGKVSNLHANKINENSVELAWSNVNDSDFKEYIIYRNDIAIGTAVSSPYMDDYLVSSGKAYRYEIAAVDTKCNIGQKAVLNVNTKVGGLVHNESTQPENIECLTGVQVPKYTLNSQYPSFREEIALEQGLNEVIIDFSDSAGNSAREVYKVYYDSIAPEILSTNLDVLTPSYTRDVTVTGTVSEDSYVCVYINSEPEIRPYRPNEVNQNANFSGTKYCENSVNKSFSIDIELKSDPDYAYDKESQTSQTTWGFVSTGDAWQNNIKIVATDSMGLMGTPEEGEILYALCGSGGDWGLMVSNVVPTEIVPRLLLEGMAQVGFEVDLTWRGSGAKPGITDIDVTKGYPYDMSSSTKSKFDTNWVSRIYDSSWSDEFDKGYVLLDLKAEDPALGQNWTTYKKEENLSKHNQGNCFNVPFSGKDQSYVKSAGCVRVPLTIKINYEKEVPGFRDKRGEIVNRSESVTQKECVNVEVLIQPRIPPDKIPNSFLEGSVKFLNATINFIDDILKPVEKALKATMIVCFVMWAVLYIKKISEGFSCMGKNVNQCKCTADASGVTCTKENGDNDDECKSCVEAKINTKTYEKYMHWVCDRVMCPAVPSYEKYIKDNSKADAKSNCAGKPYADYENDKVDAQGCEYAPKGLVSKSGQPIAAKQECCAYEYKQQWGSGCVMMDEFEESKKLAKPEYDTNAFQQIWRGISNFKLCRPDSVNEREVNIDGQWFKFVENPAYNNADEKTRETMFKWDVYVGAGKRTILKSNGLVLNDTTEIDYQDSDKLTGNSIIQSNCKKYGKDAGYMYGQAKWPEYEKKISSLDTTDYFDIPQTYTIDEMRAKVGKSNIDPKGTVKKDNKEIDQDKKQTINLNNVDYKYEFNAAEDQYKLVQDSSLYTIGADGKVSPVKKPTDVRQKQKQIVPVPQSIVKDACSGFGNDYIVNPPDSIFRSIQCVCLSALYSYLKLYKKILTLIMDCFNTILITGDGSSGVCKAVLSYYVCDLLYYMFTCFKGYSGFGGGERSDIVGFFKGIVGAGAEVQQSVSERYGDTNMFRVMFIDKKIIQSACMSFFGADTDFDLTAMAEQSITMPIRSAVTILPADRRFVGYNPIDGITNHVYHVGLMIVSGSDNMRYNAYLVCSTDNQCDTRYFKDGHCDCSYSGQEIKKDITNAFGGKGYLNQGEVLNAEAFVTVSGPAQEANFRYDKVVVEYDYMDNTGHIKKEPAIRELSQIGSEPAASCSFDVLSGAYRCSVFAEPTTACILNEPEVNADSQHVTVAFRARKETSNNDNQKVYFAELKIKDGSTTLYTEQKEIKSIQDQDLMFDVRVRDHWFGVGTGTGQYSLITSGTVWTDIGVVSVTGGTQDILINSGKNLGDRFEFEVKRGNYVSPDKFYPDNSGSKKCIFTRGGDLSQNCGYAIVTVDNFDRIKEYGVMAADYNAPGTTMTTGEKTLSYVLTVYKPQSNYPTSPSTTVASCNGIQQRKEGTFVLNKGSGATGTGKDKQPPIVKNFMINGCSDAKCIGPVKVSADSKITVKAEVSDEFDTATNTKASGLKEARLVFKKNQIIKTDPVSLKDAASVESIKNGYEFDISKIPTGLYTVYLEVADNDGNLGGEDKKIDGVWLGEACKESYLGVCALNNCDSYSGLWQIDSKGICDSGLKCCWKEDLRG